MHAPTNTPPPVDIRTAALQLAPLLIRAGLTVAVGSNGVVEVRNPRGTRMRQEITVIQHEGAAWWAWMWSGATRDDAPELEPLAPTDDEEEAARRLANVLHVDQAPEGIER